MTRNWLRQLQSLRSLKICSWSAGNLEEPHCAFPVQVEDLTTRRADGLGPVQKPGGSRPKKNWFFSLCLKAGKDLCLSSAVRQEEFPLTQTFCSVAKFCRLFATPWTAACRLSCPSPPPGVYSDSCPLNWWCHPTISPSVVPFSSSCQSFPASGCFPMSCLFASRGRSIGPSALASVFPMNIQGEFPLGLTGFISLQSEGLSRVYSSITIQRHQFFNAQVSLLSNSHICTWLLETTTLTVCTFVGKVVVSNSQSCGFQ